jgi:hypothetical protein
MSTNFDLFSDFDSWNKIHYFAFAHRKRFPNMFFFYFSYSGFISQDFASKDKTSIAMLVKEFKNKINGCWGYLSLFTSNKNGFDVYKFFSNSENFNSQISQMIIQDAAPFCEEVIVNNHLSRIKLNRLSENLASYTKISSSNLIFI